MASARKLASLWASQTVVKVDQDEDRNRGCMLKKALLVALLSIGVVSTSQAQCVLKMRTVSFKPQFYQDDHNKWHGMAIELAEAVLKEADCRPSYQNLSWKRALHLMKHGGLDMMLNVSFSKDREKYLHFVGPLRDETMILVSHKSLPDVNTFSDLVNLPKKVGVLRGAFYGKTFARKVRESGDFAAMFEVANSTDANIKKLSESRISGFFNDSYNGAYIIKNRLSVEDYKIHPLKINSDSVYIGLSKKSVPEKLKNHLQASLDAAIKKGTIDKIIAKYQMP